MKRTRPWENVPSDEETPSFLQVAALYLATRALVRLGYFNGRFGPEAADLQHLVNHQGRNLTSLPNYTAPLPQYYRNVRARNNVSVVGPPAQVLSNLVSNTSYADYLMYDLQPSAPPAELVYFPQHPFNVRGSNSSLL